MLLEEFYLRVDFFLLFDGERLPPDAEFVCVLDLPCHRGNIAYREY
jgi:hypothetical protein